MSRAQQRLLGWKVSEVWSSLHAERRVLARRQLELRCILTQTLNPSLALLPPAVGDLLVEVNGHTIKGQINLRELFYSEENCANPENTFNIFKFVKLRVVRKLGARRLRKVFPVDRREHLDALIHDLEVSEHRKNGGTNITAIEDEDDEDETMCTDREPNSDNCDNNSTDNDDDFVSESKFSEDSDDEEMKTSDDSMYSRNAPIRRMPGDFRGDINLSTQEVAHRTFYNVH